METLAQRQCVPCKGGVPPLTREELVPLLEQIPKWSAIEAPSERQGTVLMLARAYRFKDFREAMGFANRIAALAEEQQHHPDLHIAWGKVRVEIWTHKIGGLRESDAIFAAKCDAIAQ